MTLSAKAPVADVIEANSLEIEWIRRAQQDDAAAWEQIVRRYQQPIFRLAYLILGDAAEAEDTAQEAFVRAYLWLDKFDEHRAFRPWVMQITRNLARNRRRSLGRYWANLRRWWQQQPEPVKPSPPQRRASAQLLWQAVRQLKPAWQEVVYLRYFLELSEAETAETLEIAPGTVKSRLHRALAALKDVIEQDFVELIE
jgi:RNA polymerase sigma-70 factor (ECF subfamily)